MKVKKLLAALVSLSLIMSMLPCIPAHAAGVTEEILSLDFEDGNKTPTFTYDGNSYTVKNVSNTASHLYTSDNVYGTTGKSLNLKGSWLSSSKATGFQIPGISSLKDIEGGKIVISWDEALAGLTGLSTPHLIYAIKKNESTGEYESNTINLYCNESNMYIFGKQGDNTTFQTIGAKPADGEWHHYDFVLYYGTTHYELYQDDIKIFDESRASKTVGSGYVITGLCGDSNPLLNFRTKYESATDNGMYCDNIAVNRYADEPVVIVDGVTEEVLELDFEDGNKTPTFTYNGNNYTVTNVSSTASHLYTSENVYGATGKCLNMKGSWLSKNKVTGFQIPGIPSLKDIEGGKIVISWDEALAGLTGLSTPHLIYAIKKNESTGEYESNTINLYCNETNMYIFGKQGDNTTFQTIGAKPADGEWHHYDFVLYYGTTHYELYQDDIKIFDESRASKTVGSGYVITGLCGDSNPLLNFRTKYESATDNGMYCDNIAVNRYAAEPEEVVENTQFTENFGTATLNTAPNSAYYSRPNSDGVYSTDFDVETGVYGKASTDKSLKIVKNTAYSATGSQDTFYQTNKGSGFEAGGIIHITASLAFSEIEGIMNKYIALRPNSNAYTNERIMSLQYGKLVCLGNNVSVNWEAGKWYKFDIYITVGSTEDDVYSTVTVFMNGNKMFEDIEMTNKSINKVDFLRIGQQERVNKYNDVTYIDDYSIGYMPADGTPVYPAAVTLSTSTAGMRIVDTDTILVDDPDATAAQVAAAITVTGGTGSVVTDIATPASASAKAAGCYMLVTATDGAKYLYPIVNKVDRYTEDFSAYTYSNDEEILNWSKLDTPSGKVTGIRKSVTGLKGKASSDQSIENTGGFAGHHFNNADKAFPVVGMTTIEYSLLLNDPDYSENMAFAITYNDAEGIKRTQFANLLYYKGNNIEAFTTHGSGNKVGTYEYDRWYKYAFEIDPETFTADIYQNGVKLNRSGKISFMPSGFDPTDCELLNVYRFKFEHNSNNESGAVYSAIDDIKVYTGKYNAAKDAVSCTVSQESGYLLSGRWLAISEETDVSTFEENATFDNVARMTIFDDASLTTTEDAEDNEIIRHNQYIAAEASGGAIHYYRIVDQNENTTVSSKTAYAGADAGNLTEVDPSGRLELNTYRMKATYEKYNNEPEYAYTVLRSSLIDDPENAGDISFAKKALSFGANEVVSDTIDIEDTDDQLKAMLWAEDLSPLGSVFANSFVKTTPAPDGYSAPTSPTTQEIRDALRTEHPRLMITDFEALANLIKTNPTYKKWYYSYRGTANENKHSVEYLAQLYAGYDMPVYEDDDDKRIVSSETFRDRVILFAFNHKITNLVYSGTSDYYKNLVWNYLESAKDWPDWGERNQFLDTSDMIMAYAIAYDWLYDEWTAEQRATIINTIKTKGLYPAQQVFEGNSNYSSWLNKNNNWNAWCNAGVILGALAIAGDGSGSDTHQYTYLARKALESLPDCYDCLASDGSWQEGTGYWEVAMRFVAMALSSCETALGTNYGHKYAEGLSETGFYSLYLRGKEAGFGLNDSTGKDVLNFDFYFAKLFNDKYLSGIRYYQLQNLGVNPTVFDLIWYDKANVSTKFRTEIPFDKYFAGIETSTMRAGGFLDSTTAYAGLHAGYNNVPHGHLDGGTFAYETNGVRWATDLGSDDYNLFNYFQTNPDTYQGKIRWDYYRCRAEGHNTWVINPDADADQDIEGEGEIIETSFTKTGNSYSIADLTDFYKSDASSVKRGIMLNKANGALTVRDEISLKSSSTLYWFMHTKASVSISQDKKSAILTQDGRRLWVGIIDGNGTFTEMSATPLATSTDNPDSWYENTAAGKTQNSNSEYSKLSIKYTGKTGTLTQTVYMVELEDGQSTPANIPTVAALANWEE